MSSLPNSQFSCLWSLLYGRGDSVKTPCSSDFQTNLLSHFNIRVYGGVGGRRLCFGDIYERTITPSTIVNTLDERGQRWLRFEGKIIPVEKTLWTQQQF